MADDRLRGHLRGLLLATLANGPGHGYAIAQQLRDSSEGTLDVPEGSLYPALHRLEDDHLVTSSWNENGARRRRVYAISPAGKEALTEERTAWRTFRASLDAIMEDHA